MAEVPVPSRPDFSTGIGKAKVAVIVVVSVVGFSVLSVATYVFLRCSCYKVLADSYLGNSDTEITSAKEAEGTPRHYAFGVGRERAYPSARKEIGLMTYVNRLLLLLFAISGVLTILLSVILDNSFNDQPVRFTAFGVLAPVMIFLGCLASGWFPRIPLRFIACVKRIGFLKHVAPCSPWHDNVVTDFCGDICTLKSLEQAHGREHTELPQSVQTFLYGGQIFLQRTTGTATTQSTLDPENRDFQVTLEPQSRDLQEASTLDPQRQNLSTGSSQDSLDAGMSGSIKHTPVVITTDQVSSPNLPEAPSQVEDTVVQIGDSSMFHVSDDDSPMLTFDGPSINGFPLKVHVKSMRGHTFVLSCAFRDKKTRRMYLTIERLHNLVQNMCEWVENPHPIVVNESSDILHCLPIQDILWEFTKGVYAIKSVRVQHRFLAGLAQIRYIIISSFVIVSYLLSLIPLLSDKRSLFFLFFLFVLVPYLFTLQDTNPLNFYFFRSLFCPIFIKVWGFSRLYKSKSLFLWCNEFRKQRVVNPSRFWIDQDCSNRLSDGDGFFDVGEFVELPDSPPQDQSFFMSCRGWPADDPKECRKQHDYTLTVSFDTFKRNDPCYTNVRLQFYEEDDFLGDRNYSAVEIQRLHLVEKLFHCYSDPSFGGYVATICPGFRSMTYLGHCPRFLDICDKFIKDSKIPTPLVAATKPGSKFIIGVPFWSTTTVNGV